MPEDFLTTFLGGSTEPGGSVDAPEPQGDFLTRFLSPPPEEMRHAQRRQKVEQIANEELGKVGNTLYNTEDIVNAAQEPWLKDRHTQALGERLDQELPDLTPDQRSQALEHMGQAVPQAAWQNAANLAVEAERAKRAEGGIQQYGEKVAGKFPFLREIPKFSQSLSLIRAANNVEAGKADAFDAKALARHKVDLEEAAARGQGGKVVEAVTEMPAAVAEWMMLGGAGGVGKSLGEGLAVKALGRTAFMAAEKAAPGTADLLGMSALSTAEKLGIGAAGVAGSAAVRTAVDPSLLVGQAAGIEQGQSAGGALLRSARDKAISNVVFEATGAFDKRASEALWKRVGEGWVRGMTANEAAGAFQALGSMDPKKVGPIGQWAGRVATLPPGPEREAAWQDLVAQAAAMGGAEAFLGFRQATHDGADQIRASGRLDPEAFHQAVTDVADTLQELQNPPTSEPTSAEIARAPAGWTRPAGQVNRGPLPATQGPEVAPPEAGGGAAGAAAGATGNAGDAAGANAPGRGGAPAGQPKPAPAKTAAPGQPAAAAPGDVKPPVPFEGYSNAELLALAKKIGLPGGPRKREALVQEISQFAAQRLGSDFLRQIAEARWPVQPKPAAPPEPPPVAPEATPGPPEVKTAPPAPEAAPTPPEPGQGPSQGPEGVDPELLRRIDALPIASKYKHAAVELLGGRSTRDIAAKDKEQVGGVGYESVRKYGERVMKLLGHEGKTVDAVNEYYRELRRVVHPPREGAVEGTEAMRETVRRRKTEVEEVDARLDEEGATTLEDYQSHHRQDLKTLEDETNELREHYRRQGKSEKYIEARVAAHLAAAAQDHAAALAEARASAEGGGTSAAAPVAGAPAEPRADAGQPGAGEPAGAGADAAGGAGGRDFGRPLTEAERQGAPAGGQEAPGAEPARPLRETALANAVVDEQAVAEGRTPQMRMARLANTEAWDAGMAKMDADPRAAERLIEDLSNSKRPPSKEEIPLLLHRRIALHNEHERVMREYARAFQDPQKSALSAIDLQTMEAREADMGKQKDQLEALLNRAGNEAAWTLQFRRQMAKEDFSLSSMLARATVAKGEALTPGEKVQITELQTKIDALQQKLDAATAGGNKIMSPAWVSGEKVRVAVEGAKDDFQKITDRWKQKRLPPAQKVLDFIRNLRVLEVISSPAILAKLATTSAWRLLITPAEQAVGAGLSQLPGASEIARRAPSQGGASLPIEGKAAASFFVEGFKDAWQTMKTGKSDLDVAYGDKRADVEGEGKLARAQHWLSYVYRLHAALKAPAVRAEFTRSLLQREENGVKNGQDVTSPGAQLKMSVEAYVDAQRAKFQQENWLVDTVNKALTPGKDASGFEKGVKYTGQLLLPVRRIPTNIVAETANYLFGSVSGTAKAALAYRRGLETLKPAEADAIMRAWKKGSLGLGLALLGYFKPDLFGGYYREDEKKKEGEVPYGGAKIAGVDVPSWAMHHPLLQVPQFFATVRQTQDKITGPRGHREQQGLAQGLFSGLFGLAEEVPVVRETYDLGKIGNPRERGYYFGQLAKSFAIPSFVSWIAKRTDTEGDNPLADPQKRKTVGVLEQLQEGIPGLRRTLPTR